MRISIIILAIVALFNANAWDKIPKTNNCGSTFVGHIEMMDTGLGRQVTRSFRFFLPCKALLSGKPLPLIFAFHHAVVRGKEMERLTKFTDKAKNQNFMVVYPDSWEEKLDNYTRRVWNDGRGWDGEHRLVNDVQFTTELLQKLTISLNKDKKVLDRNRVYAVGIAAGGAFTQRLACQARNFFKGFAPVSSNLALPIVPSCSSGAPMMMIVGTNDPFQPFCKGESWEAKEPAREAGDNEDHCDWMGKNSGEDSHSQNHLSMISTRNFWADKNGCHKQKKALAYPDLFRGDKTTVWEVPYSNCEKAPFKFLAIKNGGHQWAGEVSAFGAGQNNFDIKATNQILLFFNKLK